MLPAAAPLEPTTAPSGEHAGQWVLIIERDVPSLVHLTDLIKGWGLAVQTAADLDEALETLQEEPAGCLLVLLAAALSPRETCDTIATLLKYNPLSTTTVAVMGDAGATVATAPLRDACLAAGAITFLPKPVDPADLRAVLAGLPAFAGNATPASQSGQAQ